MQKLVHIEFLESMAQFFGVLCRSYLLGVSLHLHTVAEFARALHIVELLLRIIQLTLHLTETLEVLIVVGDVQHPCAFYAIHLLIDGLTDMFFQSVDHVDGQSALFVVLIAQLLSQQGLNRAVEQLLQLSCSNAVAVGKIIGGKGMDVMDAHLERHTNLHVMHTHRYVIGTEGKFAFLVHRPTECERDETVAYNIY